MSKSIFSTQNAQTRSRSDEFSPTAAHIVALACYGDLPFRRSDDRPMQTAAICQRRPVSWFKVFVTVAIIAQDK